MTFTQSYMNLSDLAYKSVKRLIIAGKLRSGGVIIEARMASELCISRTPLREALQRLEGEEMVVRAGGSFVVRQVGMAEFVYSLKAREVLEAEAAELAAGHVPPAEIAAVRSATERLWTPTASRELLWRLDDDVHDLALNHCGNMVMARVLRSLRTTVRLYATKIYESSRGPARISASRVEHLDILDALEQGDAKCARKAMVGHLKSLVRQELSGLGGL